MKGRERKLVESEDLLEKWVFGGIAIGLESYRFSLILLFLLSLSGIFISEKEKI